MDGGNVDVPAPAREEEEESMALQTTLSHLHPLPLCHDYDDNERNQYSYVFPAEFPALQPNTESKYAGMRNLRIERPPLIRICTV